MFGALLIACVVTAVLKIMLNVTFAGVLVVALLAFVLSFGVLRRTSRRL